jgi:hypothetical protein
MKKKDWGYAVWTLFHTLASKMKPEYSSTETAVLYSHIVTICQNLPCPDCQEHASKILAMVNVKQVTASKDTLCQFLYAFHNIVNKRTGVPDFPKEGLDMYNNANTQRVVAHFVRIMTTNMNNEKLMMDAFRRQKYMTAFQNYIRVNGYKYNA